MFQESKIRSIVKTISWRFWATLTTVVLVLIFVGKPTIALTIGGLEVVIKMIIYFVHERTWNAIKFGKHEIKPSVIWITGLARSGKSEIASKLTEKLKKKGLKAEHLDGHSIRHLFPEIGFNREAVNEHIKRVGYLASKLEEQGVFVVASFLSPYSESREFVKSICKNYSEIYISTPLEECEKKDTTGIYAKAKNGELQNFPGVSAPYEAPSNGVLSIDTSEVSIEDSVEKIFNYVKRNF